MSKIKQPSFFDQTSEDLPLVSGTPQQAKITAFIPKPKGLQTKIKVSCSACMDTGKLGDKFCWCEVGNSLPR